MLKILPLSSWLIIFCCLAHIPANAQQQDFPGLVVGAGSILSVGENAILSVMDGDVYVEEGATLINDGQINVGRDLIIDGSLQTTLGGTSDRPLHGRIHVAGDAEYRGTLAIALARGAHFQKPQDFTINTYSAGFGTLAARQLPGARWSSSHRDSALVVSLNGFDGNAPEKFAVELDAALLNEKVVIDWIAYFDERSDRYTVERFTASGTWQALGSVDRVQQQTSAAYYSTVDDDLPAGEQVMRYRIRLEDQTGYWTYSEEVLVELSLSPKLRVFPNPVSGPQVRLLGIDQARELSSLLLTDAKGSVLRSYPVNMQDLYVLELPTNTAAGAHAIQVMYTDGTHQSAQLIIVK